MHYPICWDRDRVREVLTTESRQKARSLFLQTHRPFQQIRVDFCKEQGFDERFITEQQLWKVVHSGSLAAHNRLFFVVGEAGSGKSELSQWLEYTADPEQCIPIHIPRSMTTAIQVAALLRERLYACGTVSALSRSPIQRQVEYISLSAIVLLYERGNEVLVPTLLWETLLSSDRLRTHLRLYLEQAYAASTERQISFTPDDLRTLCGEHQIFVPEAQLASIGVELQRLLTQAIDQTLWVGDIRSLLRQLSADAVASGRRPLLLIEDITAFQSLGDILLDYLLDLTSGHFDAVIGVTTGFERTQLAKATLEGDLTHIHHRLRARFVLTDEHGRSYGLEDDLIEFTRTYLKAILPNCSSCPLQLDCDSAFGEGLYPFSETMLLRAFRSLEEEGNPRQTPRLFLEHVLSAVLLSNDLPSAVLDRSQYIARPPALFRTDDITCPDLDSMLRWYGEVSDGAVTLNVQIPMFWNLDLPNQFIRSQKLHVPRTYVVSASGTTPQPSAWQQELRELQHWLTDGGYYPSRETLKRGIERMMLMLGDPRALGNPRSLSLMKSEIHYARGDERLPIFLGAASGDVPSDTTIKVQIEPRLEHRAILEELAYLELSDDSPARVCHNLALTLDWARQHWQCYQEDIRQLFKARLGDITLEDFILSSWRLVCALAGTPWQYPPPLLMRTDESPAYEQITPWSRMVHRECYNAGKVIFQWYEVVRRLFIGQFTLRETMIDEERYSAVLKDHCGNTVLHKLAAIQPETLRALPFRIKPGGEQLGLLVSALHGYASALTSLDLPQLVAAGVRELQSKQDHLAAQRSLDLTILPQSLGQLRWRCGEIGLTWRQEWDPALATLEAIKLDELEQLHSLAGSCIADLLDETQPLDIWRYQEAMHRGRPLLTHPYWAAVEHIRYIQAELLRMARLRYQRRSRVLSSTAAYHALCRSIRSFEQEIDCG